MDLHNNETGLGLARNGQSVSECMDKCEDLAKAHKLFWFKPVTPGSVPGRGLPNDFPGFTVDVKGEVSSGSHGLTSIVPTVSGTAASSSSGSSSSNSGSSHPSGGSSGSSVPGRRPGGGHPGGGYTGQSPR